jgi:hypothetical protein
MNRNPLIFCYSLKQAAEFKATATCWKAIFLQFKALIRLILFPFLEKSLFASKPAKSVRFGPNSVPQVRKIFFERFCGK